MNIEQSIEQLELFLACEAEYRQGYKVMLPPELLFPALRDALSALRAQQAQRWIPVGERLPDVYQYENGEPIEFNVMLSDAKCATTLCFNGTQWFAMNWHSMISVGCYTVTHWQPLPEPPAEVTP